VSRVLILAAVLVLAACGGGGETSASPTQPSDSGRTIEGETLDGSRLGLSEFRGKPLVVNVWSSW
jgi:ABC-type glycerol-3-phosphate transport system substrate-binding protein